MRYFVLSLMLWSGVNLIIQAQDKRFWQLELLPGIAVVPNMPLTIHQNGQAQIRFKAHYRTESFQLPPYYSYRLTTMKNNKGWSVEMNHLKIYLDNTSSDVERFSVSHGYNQLFINRHSYKDPLAYIFGVGVVIGHPENTVRGLAFTEKGGLFNNGYYLSGIAIQGAIQYFLINTKHFSIPIEAKISMAYGQVPVVNGHAHVPIIAFHLLLGIGAKL